MTARKNTPTQAGSAVSTAIVAGIGGDIPGELQQHAEGIVVSTAIVAGAKDCPSGTCSDPTNHAEGIVVSTAIVAGAGNCTSGNCSDPSNHAEGIVVSTAIAAGDAGSQLNHTEAVVVL